MGGRSLLLTGARVYTADWSRPWAEAVGVRDGIIVHVGTESDAREAAGDAVEVLHVPGGLVVPGLNDAHIHVSYGARALTLIDVSRVRERDELVGALRGAAEKASADEWIEAFGLTYEAWGDVEDTPRAVLDRVAGERAVLVRGFDYHTAWCNTGALRRANAERGLRGVPGVIVDPATGLATGTLVEHPAIDAVVAAIPAPDEAEEERRLAAAIRFVNALGITSVQNMDGDRTKVMRYERLRSSGSLSVRAAHYVRFPHEELLASLPEVAAWREEFGGPSNRVVGLKLFLDGVIESKTAWMMSPYADGKGEVGGPAINPELYSRVVASAQQLSVPVATHAIGDGSVQYALESYAAARGEDDERDIRNRIEHIEVVERADLPRFRQLGVTASMQPLHAAPASNPPSATWNRMVGLERSARAFAWRGLADHGAVLAFGSDWPIVSADPRAGLVTAISRRNEEGEPAGGWHPEQCVTLAEALDAYTRGAAWAEGQERVKGMLVPGLLGDLTIFARDLFALSPEEIRSAEIAATIVGGEIVYRSV